MKISGRFVVRGFRLYNNGITVSLTPDGDSGGVLTSVGVPLDVFVERGATKLALGQKVQLTLDDKV